MFDNHIKHWSNGFGRVMANCMSEQLLKQIQTIVVRANFLSLSADEVIIIDNQSWMLVHAYVMHGKEFLFYSHFNMLLRVEMKIILLL